ncbi:hypothetical protein H3143_00075 [Mycoplasma tullyi]|uniref:DUF31 domain-containing protein n=1 Tax=Mycoplasma tullyi TaxID=1612150 RepID=A0A7D7UA81_9MOLU|nr:DUF31 family protein [Mycoplasma tullyi]QMT98544.1 hypothetical protein H3143_00075 [Mycoplasma tullyi]
MIKKSAWFNLLCGLSSVSFIAASCQKMQTPVNKSAEEIFSTLNKNDISVVFNKDQDKTKILPSVITEKNYFNFFNFQVNQNLDQKELDNINFVAKNFVADNQSGTLSFKLDVSVENKPGDAKDFDFRIDGFMKSDSSSTTTNNTSATVPEHDPNDCPPDTMMDKGETTGTAGETTPSNQNSLREDGVPPPIPANFPGFPNGFPFPGAGVTKEFIQKQNKYPDYVKDRYTTVDKKVIYKEIYDRTFSIRPGVFTENNGTTTPVVGQGTGWVLDYARNSANSNQLKLFIATNLHVIGMYGNTNTKEIDDMLSYSDPTGNKPSGFGIGKSKNTPTFDPQPNNQKDSADVNMVYYLHNQQKNDRNFFEEDKDTDAFTNPKIIFAAVDYLDDHALNQYKSQIDEKWEEFKTRKLQEARATNDSEEIARWEKFTQYDGKISFYTDFGILELDVDLSKADDTLKGWITDSTKAVDSYVNRIKTTAHLPNYNPETGNFFPTLDYISKNQGLASCKPSYKYGIDNAKDIYIAGYPRNNSLQTVWMQNNPSERYTEMLDQDANGRFRVPRQAWLPNKDLFSVPSYSSSTESATSRTWFDANNISIYTQLWNRPFIDRYGFNYSTKFSSLYHGASGSVVYNDFGQIVGIYDGIDSRADFGDVSKTGTFAPFVQAANIRAKNDPNIVNYAYNLIDKKGFPHQTRSYRSNLSLFYPNGFTWPASNGGTTQSSSKVTAIFPNGY